MTRRILVTGAGGFSAGHLARRLRGAGDASLIGFDRAMPPSAAGDWDEVLHGDVLDPAALRDAVRRAAPAEVYHLAGLARGTDEDLHAVNVEGTLNVVAAVADHARNAAVLLVGSAAEYGRAALRELPLHEALPCEPADGYGRTKHEAVLRGLEEGASRGLRVTVARPFNIVGAGVPATLVVGAIVQRLRALEGTGGSTLMMGNLDTARDFVAVEDVVDGYVSLMRAEGWGEIVNLCSGEPCTVRSLVETLIRAAGIDVTVEVDPALVRPSDIPVSYGSFARAGQLWGYHPTIPLAQSLRSAWEASAFAPAIPASPT